MVVVRALSLGEIDAARLSISGKGCKEINLILGKSVCREEINDQPSLICHAIIRSRIGSQVLLEFTQQMLEVNEKLTPCQMLPKTSNKKVEENNDPIPLVRVVMDKSELLGWSSTL